MEKRDGYKKTAVGWIPKDWEYKKLGEISYFSQGIQVGVEKQKHSMEPGHIRFIRIVDYTQKTSDIRFIEHPGERYIAKENDIVMVRYGTPGLIGRGIKGAIANNMFKIIPDNGIILNDFLVYFLSQPNVQKKLMSGSGSSTMPALNFSLLKNVSIIYSSLPEQKKIASILTTVDDKISSIAHQIQQTEQLKKGLMEKLLTEGIGHTEFKDTEIGRIPKGWEISSLIEVARNISDGIHATPKYVSESDYYFINGNNLLDGKIVVTEKTKCVSGSEFLKHKKELDDCTVLLSINGTIGNLAFFNDEKVILGKSACYINLSDKIDKNYIFYLLHTKRIQKYFLLEVTGTTIKNLSIKSVKNCQIQIPSIREQKQIATILSTVDDKIEVLNQKKTQYQTLKKGLSQQLLTGQMRVKI